MIEAPQSKQPREQFVYDPRNERILIGAAIASEKSKRRVLVRSIAADQMLAPAHSVMWRALRVLVDQDLDYEPELFRRLLSDEGMTVDEAMVAGIEAEAATPDNLEWHVETLRWDSTRARVLQGSLPELLRALKDPKASVDIVSATARAVLRSVEGGGGRKYMRRKSELNTEYWAEFQARASNGNVYSYGYPALDTHLVEGSAPKKTCVIAGLSGSGKSTFCADWAIRLAKIGRRVMYCPFEMGAASTLDIMVSNLTGIPIRQIVQGVIEPADMGRVRKAIAWITQNITFMENAFHGDELRKGKRSNDRNLDLFEGYIAESGCDVVIADLWERLLADLSYDGMTQALYRQQSMFAEYNVFGVIVQQLRLKDVEKRSDKRPTREGIKGTGAFVEVADQIFGVHREAQFKNVTDDTIELVCLKQRKGEANWSVAYDWDGSKSWIGGVGREVSFDPGLDDVVGVGGIEAVQTSPRRKGGGGRSRREENV